MPGRQTAKRANTRRALLTAARAVFGERGFGGASLDEIAERADLTRGALYYNFPGGKEDLFLALLDERLGERTRAIESAFAQAGGADVEASARSAADATLAAVEPNREWQLLNFEFALHAARDRKFARRLRAANADLNGALVQIIEAQAAVLGLEPPVAPADIATALSALGVGLAQAALIDPRSVRPDLFGDILALLIAGVAATASEKKGRRA